MKAWSWLVLAVVGFGIMIGAYATRPRPAAGSPLAHGFLFVGPAPSKDARPAGRIIPARVRLLPGGERAEAILKAMERALPDQAKRLRWELRPKLIVLPLGEAGIAAESLQSGRLPEPGRDEALAGGGGSPPTDRLSVGDRSLSVVGVLGPGVSLPADCVLVPASESARGLVPPDDPSVHDATFVGLSPEQFRDRADLRRLEEAFPSPAYTMLTPLGRMAPGPFHLYLAGQAAFLLGGSGVLIGLYRRLAGRVRWPVLAGPFRELDGRPRLLWGVHLAYFGLMMAASVLIYHLPEIQAVLLSQIRDELSSPNGPLGIAGKAYGSGSILRAAGVTFAINMLLGSLIFITLPSVIVPGSGACLAAVRAFLWGFLLAPTFVLNAYVMLPHSGTLLLEGEGYILATFFGLLVPIHLLGPGRPPTPGPDPPDAGDLDETLDKPPPPAPPQTILGRFGGAVLLNAQGAVLVAIVLAVAAIWEATEVIWMMNR